MIRRTKRVRGLQLVGVALVASLALAACGGDDDDAGSGGGGGGGGGEDIAISLITKDSTNPFFVAMQEGAKDAADAEGSVICTVTVMTGGGEAREVRAIGQHACAAIDRAVSLIRQSHPVASGPVLPRRSPDTAGKRVIDRRRSRSFQGERSVTIRPDEQGGRYDEGGP